MSTDVSVTCDARDQTSTQFITYTCLIVEVLSPSTEDYDQGDKFKFYTRNRALRNYLLTSGDRRKIGKKSNKVGLGKSVS